MQMHRKLTGVFSLVTLLLCSSFVSAATYSRENSVTAIVENWTASTHLYVLGNVGLSDQQLSSIAVMLESYPNWTVVLVEDANNHSWTDPEGQRHQGFLATQSELGVSLGNQPKFLKPTDSVQEKSDRSIFVISFTPRGIGVATSPLLDSYGLSDEATWNPRGFIEEAKRPLQNGRKVEEAVRNVVTRYETELVKAKRAAVAKKEADRQAAIAIKKAAKSAVDFAGQRIITLEQRAEAFRKENKVDAELTGDIATPNIVELKAKLEDATGKLKIGRVHEANRVAQTVVSRVDQLLATMDVWNVSGDRLAEFERRIQELRRDDFASNAEVELTVASKQLTKTQLAHIRADSAYLGFMEVLPSNVQAVEVTLTSAKRWATTVNLLWYTLIALSLFASLVILRSLVQRRRPAMETALALVKRGEEALEAKGSELKRFDYRRQKVFGRNRSSVKSSGETAVLKESVVDAVDGLRIMHGCAADVVRACRLLVTPSEPHALLINLFWPSRYQKVIRLLRDEEIRFHPEDGQDLEFVIEGKRQSGQDVLWADLSHFEPFDLEFDVLIDTFNIRAQKANIDLNRLENAYEERSSLLDELEESVDDLSESCDSLKELFGPAIAGVVYQIDAVLVPALGTTLARIGKTSLLDPVAAFGDARSVEIGIEKLKFAVLLLQDYGNQHLPTIRKSRTQLVQLGRQPYWIEQKLAKILTIVRHGLTVDVEQEFAIDHEEFVSLFESLSSKTVRAIEIEEIRQHQLTALKDVRVKAVDSAATISLQSHLSPENIFKEDGHDLSVIFGEVERLITSCDTELSYGKIGLCERLVKQAESLIDQSSEIVKRSLTAFGQFRERKLAIERAGHTLADKAEAAKITLADIQVRFHDDVMRLGEGDRSHPREDGSIANNMEEIAEVVMKRASFITKALEHFHAGRLLAAMVSVEAADDCNAFIKHRVEEIVDKSIRLKSVSENNDILVASIERVIEKLRPELGADFIIQSTIDKFEKTVLRFALLSKERYEPFPNPFALESGLQEVGRQLETIKQRGEADRHSHSEFSRSLEAASVSLHGLNQALLRAKGDRVPDSRDIVKAEKGFYSLQESLAELAKLVNKPHANWNSADEKVDEIFSNAENLRLGVRREMEAGGQALKQLELARRSLKKARSWSGSFGVRLSGSPGRDSLRKAQSSLQNGNYSNALRYADEARRRADSAIAEADEKVARKRREKKRRVQAEQAERRRRRAAAYSSSSADSFSSYESSSSGGFSSGGFGGSSSGGFSSGGFGGSSSGGFSSGDW